MIGRAGFREVVRSRAAASEAWARVASLISGALPLLAFPRPGLAWFAWVALVPGLVLMRSAPTVRTAAFRGWWFGTGYLLAALYWMVPSIGPGLLLVAVVFGALWAGWGAAARWLSPAAAVAVLPCVWVAIEFVRYWPRLGGPWALLGATQWKHPMVLSLAAVGGVWLISLVLVAANTALALALLSPRRRVVPLGVALALIGVGPLTYALRPAPPAGSTFRVALVQPGVLPNRAVRLTEGERITAGLPPVDLVVWGESSVGYDVVRDRDVASRLDALATRNGPLLVNEDARDASGRISKSAILLRSDGSRERYVKTRLVPFGEYIPFRSAFGWLTRISKAAGEDRVPGTGVQVMQAGDITFGPLICFESTFPDYGRAVVHKGAQMLVYQSSTSTFQDSWAPAQHASLVAVRAAETGRPAVQAALTGVTAAFDAQGRRLTWMDTGERGAAVVTLTSPPRDFRTPYDRFGDYVAYLAVVASGVTLLIAARRLRRRSPRPQATRDGNA
ncbi:apolipoprotein N-acyltransferase [Actinomadura sp. 9N407]|uniref:apolipoprotein N-acyltransferase n=1 Tax=Actinomadura sp. 9N407 TaxID=3375154 RepID=UPI003788B3EB